MNRPPVFGVTGWKNSGKTTLVVKLVSELTARGYKVSTIKHAHHEFDIDTEGTDSFRHRGAGAHEVALVSGYRFVIMHELRTEPEPTQEEILDRLGPCDLVIIEGYKRDSQPKIEVRRREAKRTTPLAPDDPNVVAVAADHEVTDTAGRPIYSLDDAKGLADLIVETLKLPAPRDVAPA